MVAWLLVPGLLSAQSRAAGRVVRIVRGDTLPLPGVAVVLHQVGQAAQGPLDTVPADRQGRFAFRFTSDSTAAYLLSARHAGIEYFSAPVATNPSRPDTGIVLVVADTSSEAPVRLRQRTLLISAPDQSGSRTVLDWFVVSNAGEQTRVAQDSVRATWGTPLPGAARDVQLADSRLSQFAPEAVTFRSDSALIFAPVSPGEKELMLQYRIRGNLRRFDLPSPDLSDSVFVLLEGGAGSVRNDGFVARESQTIEGRMFQRWAGTLGGEGQIRIALKGALLTTRQVLTLLAGLGGLIFVGLGAVLTRKRGIPRGSAAASSPLVLADRAARLDARYLGRESATPPEEWTRYLEDRARVTVELERALAGGRRRT